VKLQLAIYDLLCDLGVDETVFNAIQATGRAKTHLDRVVPSFSELRCGFVDLLNRSKDNGQRAILVDVPACITQGLPDINRGFMERRVHYEPLDQSVDSLGLLGERDDASMLRKVSSADLHRAFRLYADSCDRCQQRPICPGINTSYVEKFGTSEFVAIGS
jgi:cyclic pyranopterin phosphate synthase